MDQSVPFAQSALVGRLAWLELGTGRAKWLIYGNTRPAGGAAAGASPLVEIELDDPPGSIVGFNLVLVATEIPMALNSGSAQWGRLVNGNGDWAVDADVGAEIILSDTTIFAGGRVALISCILQN